MTYLCAWITGLKAHFQEELIHHRDCGLTLKLLVIGLLLSCLPGLAQDLPDVALGMNPQATYHSGDFDSVDLATGRLRMNIPLLVDKSQRGRLNFTYALTYSSSAAWELTCGPNVCAYSPGKSLAGVSFINTSLPVGHQYRYIDKGPPLENYYENTISEGAWEVGASHDVGGGVPLDGSGFGLNSGVQFPSPPCGGATDSNGNELTQSFSTVGSQTICTTTDTLGRTWTLTTGNSNVSGCPVAAVNTTTWNVPGPSGTTRTFTFCYSNLQLYISMPPGSAYGNYGSPISVMTGVILPDGTIWRFDYDSWGDISTVHLPTGGTISYTWATTTDTPCSEYSPSYLRTVTSRTVYDGTANHTWNYNFASTTATPYTVTDPSGNDTVATQYIIPPSGPCTGSLSQSQYYSGTGSNRSLIKTVTNTYQGLPDPYPEDVSFTSVALVALLSSTTQWANGQESKITKTYDCGYFSFKDSNPGGSTYTSTCPAPATNPTYGLVTAETQYDYGNGAVGAPLAITNTSYLSLSNSNYRLANLFDLVSSTIVTDASGNKCSETDYGYDESAPDSSGVSKQLVAPPFSVRGNLTSIKRQLFTNPCSTSAPSEAPLTTTNHVYDTGMIHTVTDPLNNPPTTYSYSGTYYGAYPTAITNALNQQTNYTYDFNTGLVTALQDPNDVANGRAGTTYTYDDMLRPLTVNYPDNGETTIGYNYSGNVIVGDTITKKITSALNQVTSQVFNGLGLLKQTQAIVPPSTCPSGTSYVDTTYDSNGRQFSVSNPYCTTSDATYGLTSTYYDALNRVTSVVEQDGGTISDNYANFPCTTVTDEAGKAKTSCVDGAGRMTSVVEDPGTSPHLNYQTTYTYDALADLLSVTQSSSRQRSFSYDSLSHLLSASNPESNTVNYTYDANGNVLTKTDARGFTINYSPANATIDPLNRVRGKTYSNGDPEVTFGYDGNAPAGCSPTLSITNGIGMRTGMCDAAGNEGWNYDPMGRVQVDQRTTSSVTLSTTYGYNLDGSVASLIDPSLRTITYTPNDAAQPVSAVDAANNINYVVGPTTCPNGQTPSPAGGVCYTPLGLLAQMVSGQNLVTTSYFNSRLQPCRVSVNSNGTPPGSCVDGANYGNVLDYTYNFAAGTSDNGNVDAITNNLTKYTSTDRSQQFFYDGVNRVSEAGTVSTSGANCWGEQYGYDNWGNLLSIGQWTSNYTGCTQESGFSITATANNQISGFCYDAAGNLLAYSPSPCTPVYTYNSENQLTSTAGVTYTYDGDGKRVEKSNGTLYWYGTSADPLVETNASGTLLDEYIFFGGKRIAQRDSLNNVQYYFGNHLGSTTVLTESNGVAGFIADYYPFGQERDNPQATNYLLESNAFDQSPWQTWDTGTPTITPNATTAPDGALAEKVSFPAGSYSRRVQDFNGVVKGGAAGNTFTYSIWLRADAPLTVRFDLEDEVSGNYDHTSGIVNVTTQWQQFSVTRTIRAGASDAWAEIGNHYNDAVTTTFYAWGAQVSEATIGFAPGFKFTGKERDPESGLDNFGARYDSSQYGRFMTPDPVLSTPVHIINPQRWNKYTYAVNDPISYVDPDGRDAIAVNFSKAIPIVGHEGFIAVDGNGAATYERYGPTLPDMPVGVGQVTEYSLSTKVIFGPDGLPTPDSYKALAAEVGSNEKEDPSTLRMNYFKTSTADTLRLKNLMDDLNGRKGLYIFCLKQGNCAGLTIALLQAGGIIDKTSASLLSLVPNLLFGQLTSIADQTYVPMEVVTHTIGNADETCGANPDKCEE